MNFSKKSVLFVTALFAAGVLMGAFTQIDLVTQVQGILPDANVASTLARDSEVTSAVSTHNGLETAHKCTTIASAAALASHEADNSNVHQCTTVASAAAVALKADKMAATKRETVTIGGVATTTVTFAGTPVPSTIDAAVVAINGLVQVEGTFTRTSNRVIESTAGTIAAGAIVTIYNLE